MAVEQHTEQTSNFRLDVPLHNLLKHSSAPAKGLYPVGEGAGYAGGILSAAIDGITAAEFVGQCCLQNRLNSIKSV